MRSTTMSSEQHEIGEYISELQLVDHHVHGPLSATLPDEELAELFTESDRPVAIGTARLDTQVGFAVRAHCAPLLGLPRHASAADYFDARRLHSPERLAEIFMRHNGISRYLIDTGIANEVTFDIETMARVTETPV